MKRVRVQRLAGQLLSPSAARSPALLSACASCSSSYAPSTYPPYGSTSSFSSLTTSTSNTPRSPFASSSTSSRRLHASLPLRQRQAIRPLSTSVEPTDDATPAIDLINEDANTEPVIPSTPSAFLLPPDPRFPELSPDAANSPAYPSPLPERARSSAKLAALHARLGLSQRLPLETLARSLVDPSADASPRFNNGSLSYLGYSLINYHVAEWLMCKYPRLPMVIIYGAMKAYAGSAALADVAKQWGIETAAAPGAEVDPGLLQFSLSNSRQVIRRWGYDRAEAANINKYKWRHGISSRVIFDDDFGDKLTPGEQQMVSEPFEEVVPEAKEMGGSMDSETKLSHAEAAHANAVRAVAGAIYAHSGREAVRSFVRAHVLSRQLDLETLFRFKLPTRELTYLCARESFEPPVARLESETGRKSRTPVFVVGIYSGNDKLGEGAAASLDAARTKAAMNALKAWYLYSPGENVRVPSDMLSERAAAWKPSYIDIGEIL
ncbi:54s ribosomal protein l3 [Ophiostoma piceae UAMH 11346]|uniref:Large ribosomal subunit protein mL44 n=1 Tax=Ophiostoma piceae (strain UAMH 11346) TaxID=1262450 RepID=S3CAR9_OPHP1|nr:54s ribosomal protein l3 [Ophiostoma piceae UAMH 11346]